MNKSGLVSISFRKNTVDEIIAACVKAGLSAIEWGSDVHVSYGNIALAVEVANKCAAAGIECPSYGSYYRLGETPIDEFKLYLDTALALGAKTIRIWGGSRGSAEITVNHYYEMIEEAKKISDLSKKQGITLCLECHNWTVTDNFKSALKFLNDVGYDNHLMYWQPNQLKDLEYNLDSAKALADKTVNIHVFNWDKDRRYPLADAVDIWKRYVDILGVKSHYYMLEFMPDDKIEFLDREAVALSRIINGSD